MDRQIDGQTDRQYSTVLTSFWADLVQKFDHALTLGLGPPFDGRPSPYLGVLLLDLWGPSLSNSWA